MSHQDRTRVRDAIGSLSSPRQFLGSVNRVEAAYGFVTVDGRGDSLVFHESDVVSGVWDHLSTGGRVAFTIGFNLRGPKALSLHLEGRMV
jgi:cold shock CspA family protein